MNEHLPVTMKDRMNVLTPSHLVDAARALVFRLRVLHEGYAERGGDAAKFAKQHARLAEALANLIAVLVVDDAFRDVAAELRAGLGAALQSAKTLGV